MNFKHNKFEDSEVMRSLEKLAVQKGLVKAPEATITKEASAKLSATGNLTQDIVTLCEGLRTSGFTKEANEIESNFIMFKQADTLYQTSKETGEDLVDAAHPDGSHQLSGLKHKVLTITDRHQEILDKVNKKPSGKLATSHQIINAVKKALGQNSIADKIENYRTLYSDSLESMKQAVSLYSEILNEVERRSAGYETGKVKVKGTEYDVPVVFAPAESYNQSFKILGEEVNRVPAEDEFEEIKNKIEKFKSRINSSWFFGVGGLTNKDRDAIYSKLDNAASGVIFFINTAASQAKGANSELLELRKTSFSSNKKEIFKAIKEAFTSLKEIKQYVEDNADLRVIPYKKLRFTPENFIKQIDKLIKELTDLHKQLKSSEINSEQIEEIKTRVDKIKSTAEAAKQAISDLTPAVALPAEETSAQKTDRKTEERTAAEAAQEKPSKAESQANEEKVNKIKENINFFKQDYTRYAKLLGNKPDNVPIGPASTPRKKYFETINTAFTNQNTYDNLESLKATFRRHARTKKDADFLSIVLNITNNWNILMDDALFKLDPSSSFADDGMVSAATLNAMKALKISLGQSILPLTDEERKAPVTRDDRVRYSTIAKTKAISLLKDAVNRCYDAGENNARALLTSSEHIISALRPHDDPAFYDTIESILDKYISEARMSVTPFFGNPNELQGEAIRAINKLEEELLNIRGYLTGTMDIYIKLDKAKQNRKTKTEEQSEKVKKYNEAISGLSALITRLQIMQQNPRLILNRTIQSAKDYINEEISEINSFKAQQNLNENQIKTLRQSDLDKIAEGINNYIKEETANIDQFETALKAGSYDIKK